MKLSKAQSILLALTLLFATFTLAFFIGRSSVHAVIATERASESPERAVPMAPESEPEPKSESEPEPAPMHSVNLNTAQKSELVELPGIGEVLADRILRFREENGGFICTEQLMDVEGIGEKKYEEVKALIYVEDSQ